MGQAVELMLKAYHARKGKSEADTRAYGHSIRRLFDDAIAQGLVVSERQRNLLYMLDDIHAELRARYVKTHSAPVVRIEEFDPVVQQLFRTISEEFGNTGGWVKFWGRISTS